jgi:streptogramin lyase
MAELPSANFVGSTVARRASAFAMWLALLAPPSLGATTITGVTEGANGQRLAGVMIRVTDPASGISESVFSDASGFYRLTTDLAGRLSLRARTPYFRDTASTIEVRADATLEHDVALDAMTDDAEISESLPAAYHFGSLPFETGDGAHFNRFQFQRDCLSCHQIGNPLTRTPRDAEGWSVSIQRMHAYLGNFDAALRDARAVILARGFDGKPIDARPHFPVDPALADAKIYEYRLDTAGVPHDAIVNAEDGLIYTVDQALDHMAITDPRTGRTEYVPQAGGAAMSYYQGNPAESRNVGLFDPANRHGPHSLDLGPDGRYYVTNTGTNSIGVFDPKTRSWQAAFRIDPATKANYPHTIRVDRKGIVWFTLAGSEHVGRLDPTTGHFDILPLPHVVPGGISGGTQPYGIDIHPVDGSVWYGRLFGDRIGRVDPVTLAITEFDSPVRGPRRMHFDRSGTLWVTGYSEGQIARIDPNGFVAKVYDMPEFAPGFRPAPYALGVHPQTQDIWINENMTDRVFRFIPGEERFIAYPVPLSGTYTRDMTFTPDGRVCLSNNPIPATALEGGVLEVICIDADDRRAQTSAAAR